MESTRQKKFAKVIQKELSLILSQMFESTFNCLITVSFVKVTPDLHIARVYLTVMPDEKRGMLFKTLELENKRVRFALASVIRNQVKQIPELEFYEDDVLKKAAQIDELLDKVNKGETEAFDFNIKIKDLD